MTHPLPELTGAFHTQHRKRFNKDHVFDKRQTTSFELVYFLEGSCKMILDETQYQIEGDQMVFRYPGQWNQSFMPYESILLCFDFPSNNPEDSMPLLVKNIPSIIKTDCLSYKDDFQQIYQESLFPNDLSHYLYSEKLTHILLGLTRQFNRSISPSKHWHPVTEEAITYIHEHLSHPMTVPLICDVMHISQRQLYQRFTEDIKKTPLQYITHCRLEKSKKLLTHSNNTVTEISQLCGYDNSAYFIQVFKNHTGFTPLKYRQKKSTMFT